MNVKLLSTTSDPMDLMYIAARTCYSAKSPIDLANELNAINNESIFNLVNSVLESGHTSIAEHVHFTFAIEGISRACSHQLVRHRLCTFSQQSQRYVEIKENYDELHELISGFSTDEKIAKMVQIAQTYFVDVTDNNYYGYVCSLCEYARRIASGESKEDARNSLPNACKTNIVVTTNLRNLMHICDLRLCTRAQTEIRTLFKSIKSVVNLNNPNLGRLLLCQCDRLGYCPEGNKCCGRKPRIDKIKEK